MHVISYTLSAFRDAVYLFFAVNGTGNTGL